MSPAATAITELQKKIKEICLAYERSYFMDEALVMFFNEIVNQIGKHFPEYSLESIKNEKDEAIAREKKIVFLKTFIGLARETKAGRFYRVNEGRREEWNGMLPINRQLQIIIKIFLTENSTHRSDKDTYRTWSEKDLREGEKMISRIAVGAFLHSYKQEIEGAFIKETLYTDIIHLLLELGMIRYLGHFERGHEQFRKDPVMNILTAIPNTFFAVHGDLFEFNNRLGILDESEAGFIPDLLASEKQTVVIQPVGKIISHAGLTLNLKTGEVSYISADESIKIGEVFLKRGSKGFILLQSLLEKETKKLDYKEVATKLALYAPNDLSSIVGVPISNLRKKIFGDQKELAKKVLEMKDGYLSLKSV